MGKKGKYIKYEEKVKEESISIDSDHDRGTQKYKQDIKSKYVIVIDEHQSPRAQKPNDSKRITLSQIDTGSLPHFDDDVMSDDESQDEFVESVSDDDNFEID